MSGVWRCRYGHIRGAGVWADPPVASCIPRKGWSEKDRLIFRPDTQTQPLADCVRLLDQVFFPSASGSRTSTTPSLRLRVTVPVLHHVRSFCQVQPASCKTHQIV